MNLEGKEMGQQQIPDKLVVLTFDDALVNHAIYVVPMFLTPSGSYLFT